MAVQLILSEEPAKLNILVVSQVFSRQEQVSVQLSHFTSLVVQFESKSEALIRVNCLLGDQFVDNFVCCTADPTQVGRLIFVEHCNSRGSEKNSKE